MKNKEVYQEVTDAIIRKMEEGVIPWENPYRCGCIAYSYATKKPYSLLNQVLIGEGGEYITFNLSRKLGGQIVKGAKAKTVIYCNIVEKGTGEYNEDGDEIIKKYFLYKESKIFRVGQDVIGITPHREEELAANSPIKSGEEAISAYINREGISLTHEFGLAYYMPKGDTINIPPIEGISDSNRYYSTFYHECIHSTGATNRLNRNLKGHFGGASYSKEELVAEFGAGMLCNLTGIENECTLRNSAAYIQSWIKFLKDDPKVLMTAAAQAERAVKYFRGEISAKEGSVAV